ncbi:hypothetical protein GJ496_008607 [Pomphorhynchus laevis]|nr:hypothetical protein GJ496_008607 [Pomphorhynchus laevis]
MGNLIRKYFSSQNMEKKSSFHVKFNQTIIDDSLHIPNNEPIIPCKANYIVKGRLLSDSRQIASQLECDKRISWYFTENDIQMLQGSSKRVMQLVENRGRDLFNRVFQYDYDFKSLVKLKRNYSEERIDVLFNTHADRVQGVIHDIIRNVNNVPYVYDVLENLGRVHVGYRVEELHMDIMLCNFLDTLHRFDWENWCDRLEHVWLKFLKIMLGILLTGMRKRVNGRPSGYFELFDMQQ